MLFFNESQYETLEWKSKQCDVLFEKIGVVYVYVVVIMRLAFNKTFKVFSRILVLTKSESIN